MKEKKSLKRIILYLFFSFCLAVTSVCTMTTVWMIQNKYVSETTDSFQEKQTKSRSEMIAAKILTMYFTDGAVKVTKYCQEQGIEYTIYHQNGVREAGNMVIPLLSEFYSSANIITFDADYNGYYTFPGIQYYRVILAFKDNPSVKFNDPEILRYWSFVGFVVKYKFLLWAITVLFVVLSLSMGKKLRRMYKQENIKKLLPLDVEEVITGLLIFGACMIQIEAKYPIMVILRNAIVAWLLMNGLMLIVIRIGTTHWKSDLLTIKCITFLSRNFKKMKRNSRFQITFRLYSCGFVVLSVLEIAMIAEYTQAQVIFMTCFVLEKLLLIWFVAVHLNKYRLLQDFAEKIAEGNFDNKVDVDALPMFLRRLGENLNAIDGSVSLAISERVKTEHFKTELITNVSHDLKTPLTSIINFSDLIKNEQTENKRITEYADHLFKQSTNLKKLVEDLIEASRASTGNIEAHMEPCDARVILGQCQGEFVPKLSECEIELIVKNCADELHIMADPAMLARVFDNLLSNICKYTLSGTRVYISTEKVDNKARITFKNTSKNRLDDISADELMERFVRGDLSRHSEGHGLGLSIVKSLMDLQQGTVELSVDGDLFKVMLEFHLIENA